MERNQVFASHLHRGNGLFTFHWIDQVVIGVAFGVGVCLVFSLFERVGLFQMTIPVGMAVLTVMGLLWARKKDNHRIDHLELRLRSLNPPMWSLCEGDSKFKGLCDDQASKPSL